MKRVAVLRGGPSDEYDVSMLSGAAVLGALKQLEYPHKDIVITKKGEWLESGFTKTPQAVLEGVDIVFIALHGQFGEDGQVQNLLQRHNISYTGSRSLSSAIAFNKELAKQTLKAHDIKLPRHRTLRKSELRFLVEQNRLGEEIDNIFAELGQELFIKPVASGSSQGANYIPNKETLKQEIFTLLDIYEQVIIEEYIRGREASVGVLSNFREQDLYSLPVIEIIPKAGGSHFSREQKYSGEAKEIVPGRFSYHEKSILSDAAALVHKAIACKDYSRSDFIVRDGEVYFLEINTLPGLTKESLFPKAAESVGLEFEQLIKHLLKLAHPH